MGTKKTESAVIVPEVFLSESDDTADGYVLIVEGTELNVSKGALALQSKPLRATMFNKDSRHAGKKGKVELKGKKLRDVVPLLCWVIHEEDPAAKNKTYGALGKGKGIANEDLPALIALGHEWEMKRLLKDCQDVYTEFISKGSNKKTSAMLALEIMAVLDREGLKKDGFGKRKTPAQLIKAGINIGDINAVGVNENLRTLLLKKVVSKGPFKNKAEALKALDVLESLKMTDADLSGIAGEIIYAGIDINDIDAAGVANPIRSHLVKNFVCNGRFANKDMALKVLAELDGLEMTGLTAWLANPLIRTGITIEDMDAHITSKNPIRISIIKAFANKDFVNKATALKALGMLEGLGTTETDLGDIMLKAIHAGVSKNDIAALPVSGRFRNVLLKDK